MKTTRPPKIIVAVDPASRDGDCEARAVGRFIDGRFVIERLLKVFRGKRPADQSKD